MAVCAVEGVLALTVGFKVLFPNRTWTQRYLQVGCGGLCGRISPEVGAAEGCAPLDAGGFAIASTDMGHKGWVARSDVILGSAKTSPIEAFISPLLRRKS